MCIAKADMNLPHNWAESLYSLWGFKQIQYKLREKLSAGNVYKTSEKTYQVREYVC
jgi:hypothetical protein